MIVDFSRILNEIRQEELTDFLQKAVQIPSDIETPGEETKIAHFIAETLKKDGIDSDLQMVAGETGESPNVIATLKGGSGKSITFNGHMDAVPPMDMKTPYSGKIVDGKLYGRGACDMKSGIIAMAYAMIAIKRSGVSLPGDLVLSAMVGEEYGSYGARDYVKRNSTTLTDYGVCGEPTDLRIGSAQKGLHWFEFTIPGKRTHSSVPNEGVNALKRLTKVMAYIADELEPGLAQRVHPLLGPSLVNMGKAWGGEQPNVVPGEAFLQVERRHIPGETQADLEAEMQRVADACSIGDPAYEITFKSMPYSVRCPKTPMHVPDEHPIVQSAKKAGIELGLDLPIIGVPFWGDAGVLFDAGVPCILFGPGRVKDAHSATECVVLEDVYKAAQVYALMPFCLP
jgi:acetylornithine deacetylase or succinyl-diaminopimelate desuccinylase